MNNSNNKQQRTSIVMRAYNDMPIIKETLEKLSTQTIPFQLIVFDNDSQDGTKEEAEKYADQMLRVPAGTYMPGRVINQGMEVSQGEFVVFLNSDCIPQHPEFLENLLKGFQEDPNIAAVFGRQIPREDCYLLFHKDTEYTFSDGERQKRWRQCFSMASSAIRRSVWEKIKFNETFRYSEEIEWSWRLSQQGYNTAYVPDSVVIHSHNYTLKQHYKRQYGEARAEALIFDWSSWQASFFRYSLLPYGKQVLSDWKYSLKRLNFFSIFHSPMLRMAQLFGRRAGFQKGLREKRQQHSVKK